MNIPFSILLYFIKQCQFYLSIVDLTEISLQDILLGFSECQGGMKSLCALGILKDGDTHAVTFGHI